jgi:hypothetical protein
MSKKNKKNVQTADVKATNTQANPQPATNANDQKKA